MRVNAANRSFFSLVATALVPYLLLGLVGCGLLGLIAYRVASEGMSGLTSHGQDLRPAVVFLAVVGAATVLGARSALRQVAATRSLAAEVARRASPPPARVNEAATRAALGGRVDVVADARPYSFTYGLSRPRVALSTGLVAVLSVEELEAVLHHERYHVRNADTVKAVIARAAMSAFFFLPVLRHLGDRYLNGRELAADRAAVRATADRAIAGALFKVLDGPSWTDLEAAAALGGGVLDRRVAQLEDGREPPVPSIPGSARWLTGFGLAVLVGLYALAVARAGVDVMAMDDSMPGGGGMAMSALGGVACTVAVAAAVAFAVGGGRRRRPTGPR